MKVHRIKRNWRYVIYEIGNRGDYYLVDVYDHWWAIFFPSAVWFVYHKAYPLTHHQFCKLNVKKFSGLSIFVFVGIVYLLFGTKISNSVYYLLMIILPTYVPNVMYDAKLFHTVILIFLVVVGSLIYWKSYFKPLPLDQDYVYMRIGPQSMLKHMFGPFAPLMIYGFIGFFISIPYIEYNFLLLNIPTLFITALMCVTTIYLSYGLMIGNEPYDYEIKNDENEESRGYFL